MANIDQYLAEIRSAIYGEEVRGSIINALEAQNNETENNTTTAEQALADAQEAITNAQTAADTANTAAAGADESGENAVKIATEAAENATQTASDAAAEAVEIAQTAADNATQTASDAAAEAVQIAQDAADSAENTANEAAENANTAANAANAAAMTQIASYDITYQASSIGTEPPTGEWIHSIPQVAEGNYLWTRVIIISVSGDETTFYSVGKMGSSSGGEGGGNLWYGQCETTGNTTSKTVACDGFNLDTGVEIVVKFQYTNTASNATMNVNSTGAYPIYYDNSNIASGLLRESGTYFFVFDGSHYAVVGELSGAAIDELQQDVAQINEDLSAYDNVFKTGVTVTAGSSLDEFLKETISDNRFTFFRFNDSDNVLESRGYQSWKRGLIMSQNLYGSSNDINATVIFSELTTTPSRRNLYLSLVNGTSGSYSNTTEEIAYQTDLTTINTSLSDLQTSVSTNTSNISDLDEKVEQNTADIEQNTSDITEINSALTELVHIINISTITVSTSDSIAANSTGSVSVTITRKSTTSTIYCLIVRTGWCNVSYMSLSGNTLSVEFLNAGSGSHSGLAEIAIVEVE